MGRAIECLVLAESAILMWKLLREPAEVLHPELVAGWCIHKHCVPGKHCCLLYMHRPNTSYSETLCDQSTAYHSDASK